MDRLAREKLFETLMLGDWTKHVGCAETRCGEGSTLKQTAIIRKHIPMLVEVYGIGSILDLPCGDCSWISHIWPKLRGLGVSYIGGDISKENIRIAGRRMPGADIRQLCAIEDFLPKVDLIFCRDLLCHLSEADAKATIANFKLSQSAWLAATTFPGNATRTGTSYPGYMETGNWTALDLEAPPFRFPVPEQLINEGCTELDTLGWGYTHKSIGLWKLSALP